MARIANATVETLTKGRRIDSPQGVIEQEGRSSEWRTSAGGETLSLRSTFCQLGIVARAESFSPRLYGRFCAGTFVIACGNSSVGRAQPCQGWGRGFESRFPLSFFSGPVSVFPLARRSPLGWRN